MIQFIKKSKLIISFLLFTLLSSAYLIKIKWNLPLADLFLHHSQLPPFALANQLSLLGESGVGFLSGGILAIVSLLLQQVVRNNLASDSTLAVDSGAQFAMVLSFLFFPSLAVYGGFWLSFIGALISLGIVVLIALPSKLDPLVLIIAGFIMSIFIGSAIMLMMLVGPQFYSALTLWSSGLLYQVSWEPLIDLSVVSVLALSVLMLFHKPLTVMSLEDNQASRLGLPVRWIRFAIFVFCALLTATVISNVGIISFVGLGAATVVNSMEIRHIRKRLTIGFFVGGLLLWLTNNFLNIVEHHFTLSIPLPAGSFTGVLGAPLIIWLILKQRKQRLEDEAYDVQPKRQEIDWWLYIIPLVILFAMVLVFVHVGNGWQFSFDIDSILRFRLGRSLGAFSAGVLLAIAGVIIQQMTRNPMASPEVLGVSSIASMSIVVAFLLYPTMSVMGLLGYGLLGSFISLIGILWLARMVNSTYLLLIGIAIGALMGAVWTVIGLADDPRLEEILRWMSGSSYHVRPMMAYVLVTIAFITFLTSHLLIKPLKLLNLNESVARSLGLNVKFNEMIVLTFVAVASTVSTIAVGPLSFIGLMTPQLARSLGAVQLEKQLPLSALLGGLIMVIADWIGRYINFPYEIPAGIVASMIGGAYFLLMMRNFK